MLPAVLHLSTLLSVLILQDWERSSHFLHTIILSPTHFFSPIISSLQGVHHQLQLWSSPLWFFFFCNFISFIILDNVMPFVNLALKLHSFSLYNDLKKASGSTTTSTWANETSLSSLLRWNTFFLSLRLCYLVPLPINCYLAENELLSPGSAHKHSTVWNKHFGGTLLDFYWTNWAKKGDTHPIALLTPRERSFSAQHPASFSAQQISNRPFLLANLKWFF